MISLDQRRQSSQRRSIVCGFAHFHRDLSFARRTSARHVSDRDAAEHDNRYHHRQVRDPEQSVDHPSLQFPRPDAICAASSEGYATGCTIIHGAPSEVRFRTGKVASIALWSTD